MKKYLTRGRLLFLILLAVGALLVFFKVTSEEIPDWVTGTVSVGTVQQIVAVSGVIEAEGEASLSFPVTGVVQNILVTEGIPVTKDQVLATLVQDELLAERKDAYAALLIAEADRSELIEGPRSEARDVTDAALTIAQFDLERTVSEEAKKVANAYRTLLSEDLEALPINRDTQATAPIVSGTYTCAKEGMYTLALFRSGSQSGYSYRLSGLEEGTYTAHTESPAPLGTCGLSIQFAEGESYGNKTWEILIPNTRDASYTSNLNAYSFALEQEKNAVLAATQVVEKTSREQELENAIPRTEALSRANAAIMQAEARLAVIDARLKEHALRAPFDGVISAIGITEGEVATGEVMTLVASDIFELTVRVPEIDITKLNIGQSAEVQFDARPDELMNATVGFISETATELDGVAYFEAKLRFTETPTWFRSGLNADVHIIVDQYADGIRIPRRFLVTDGDAHYILFPNGATTSKESVDVLFTGNDGFVAVSGNVRDGDTVVAP